MLPSSPPPEDPPGDPTFAALDLAFDSALRPWRSGEGPVSLLFSGGVDSGLLAWELRRRSDLTLVTVGMPGSADLRAAASAASALGLRWAGTELTRADVRAMEERIRDATDGRTRTARSVLVALALALADAPAPHVLCGQGVDELFLGYAHYRSLEARSAEARSDEDLRILREEDWPLARTLANRLGRDVAAPYLDPGFTAAARRIPIERRLPGDVPKALFRRWAQYRGLPASIALRPKRALQYGSGIDRLVAGTDSGRS